MTHNWLICVLFVSFRGIESVSRNSQHVLFVSFYAFKNLFHKQNFLFHVLPRITIRTEKFEQFLWYFQALLAESDDDEDTILDTGNIGDTRA